MDKKAFDSINSQNVLKKLIIGAGKHKKSGYFHGPTRYHNNKIYVIMGKDNSFNPDMNS
jgi:hypothetical protein